MSEIDLRLDGYGALLKIMIDLEVERCKIFKKCKDSGMSSEDSSKLVNEIHEKAIEASNKLPIHI